MNLLLLQSNVSVIMINIILCYHPLQVQQLTNNTIFNQQQNFWHVSHSQLTCIAVCSICLESCPEGNMLVKSTQHLKKEYGYSTIVTSLTSSHTRKTCASCLGYHPTSDCEYPVLICTSILSVCVYYIVVKQLIL